MKESEFIELLNLYLDHEISAADAARLEAEVQANLTRRKVYQQYCRMQKACKILAVDFQTEEADADKKVVPFSAATVQQQRGSGRGFYAIGGLVAAAACLAFIFVKRGEPVAPKVAEPAPIVAQTAPVSALEVKTVAAVQEATPAATRGGIRSVAGANVPITRTHPLLVSDPLLLSSPSRAMLTSANLDSGNQLAWIENLKITPMQTPPAGDTLRFDTQAAVLRPESRSLGVRPVQNDENVEQVVIRFIK